MITMPLDYQTWDAGGGTPVWSPVVPGPEAFPVMQQTAIIIGAGPAGLTAAYELLERTGIVPIVLEAEDYVGGLSRTANYKGNRLDIGGHRFFSKSDRVMEWWLRHLPMERGEPGQATIGYQGKRREVAKSEQGPDPQECDEVMLLRQRKSRIYFLRKFFDYPITLSLDTIKKLGLLRIAKIGLSYLRAVLFPFRPEKNLEEFFINRFGRELYRTFFKSYTEKVWGESCSTISAEWGAQRIKGLSILGTLKHVVGKLFRRRDLSQKDTETSLIEQFLYPKYGPGQMWETVARKITARGGRIIHHQQREQDPRGRPADRGRGGGRFPHRPGHRLSRRLVLLDHARQGPCPRLGAEAPAEVRQVSEGLVYRDFITVGLLLKGLKVRDDKQGQQLDPRQLDLHPGTGRAAWAACRSSTTGAPTWWPTAPRSGSAWSTSATRATTCGRCRTRN